MTGVLRTPDRRVCERCGRVERYDEDIGGWRAAEAGDVHCIHEWDIDGEFIPIQEAVPTAAAEEC